MNVKFVTITPDCENLISYCARVSAPANQENYDTAPKLIKYLIKHSHWSPLELVNLVIEIETGRDISAQIMRHRSFSFQEFSQRYAVAELGFEKREARSQDLKNRQNSVDDLSEETKRWFDMAQKSITQQAKDLYDVALKKNIAKESARSLLPLSTTTRLYVNGTIRSWVHYCLVRCEKSTQLEHRLVANECWKILREKCPTITATIEELNPFMKEIV